MATTSPELAAAVLDGLLETGLPFAVLHKERNLAAGQVSSDVDIVTDVSPRILMESAYHVFTRVGLRPIIGWLYDVGALTVFLITVNFDGVQLDILHDKSGHNRYGIRADVAVRSSVRGERWPRLHPDDELLYLIRKRAIKRDEPSLLELLHKARSVPSGRLQERAVELMGARAKADVLELISGRYNAVTRRRGLGRPVSLTRYAKRLLRPTGFWVEIRGDEERCRGQAVDLAHGLGRVLPVARAFSRPVSHVAQGPWALQELAPVRWRPGVAVTWSASLHWPAPDLSLSGKLTLKELTDRVISVMARRLPWHTDQR